MNLGLTLAALRLAARRSIGHKGAREGPPVAKRANWTCPNCARRRTAAFCPTCGEEPLRPRDLKVDDLATRLLGALSSVDGRLMRSFRLLLVRPGVLTEAYVAGRRRSYVGPLQLFLIANALFFALQSLTGIEIFSSPLASHLYHQDWSAAARPLVAAGWRRGTRRWRPTPRRSTAPQILNAKALIILMALAFAPLLPLFFHRARRAFGAHVIFALHLYTFILLLMCVALLVAWTEALAGGGGLASPMVDKALSLFNIAAVALYLYLASGAFYGTQGGWRIMKALALAAAVGGLALGYRFLIFLMTLQTS